MSHLFISLFVSSAFAWAEPKRSEKITYFHEGYNCTAVFDPSRHSAEKINNASYLLLTVASTSILHSINLCNVKMNPSYKECGTRKPESPHYLHNAKVNLDENQKVIAKIKSLEVPTEVESLKKAVVEDLNFYQALQKTLFEYFAKRDQKTLEKFTFEKVDAKLCLAETKELNKLSDPVAIEKAVHYNWQNCLIRLRQGVSHQQAEALWKKLILSENCEDTYEEGARD